MTDKELQVNQMKLPRLPRTGSILEAKYTAKQMKDYALKAMMAENEACEKNAQEWVHAYPHPSKLIAEKIKARRAA
jgi:hypothetical protein